MLDISAALQDALQITPCPQEGKPEAFVTPEPEVFAGILAAQKASQSHTAGIIAYRPEAEVDAAVLTLASSEAEGERGLAEWGAGGEVPGEPTSAESGGEQETETPTPKIQLTLDAGSAEIVALPIAQDWLPYSNSPQAIWGNFTEPASTNRTAAGEIESVGLKIEPPAESEKSITSVKTIEVGNIQTLTRMTDLTTETSQTAAITQFSPHIGASAAETGKSIASGDNTALRKSPETKATGVELSLLPDAAPSETEDAESITKSPGRNPGQGPEAIKMETSGGDEVVPTPQRQKISAGLISWAEKAQIEISEKPVVKESATLLNREADFVSSRTSSEVELIPDDAASTAPQIAPQRELPQSEADAAPIENQVRHSRGGAVLDWKPTAGTVRADEAEAAGDTRNAVNPKPVAPQLESEESSLQAAREKTVIAAKTPLTYAFNISKTGIAFAPQNNSSSNDLTQTEANNLSAPMSSGREEVSSVDEPAIETDNPTPPVARKIHAEENLPSDAIARTEVATAGLRKPEIKSGEGVSLSNQAIAPEQLSEPVGTEPQIVALKNETSVNSEVIESGKSSAAKFGEVIKSADARQKTEMSNVPSEKGQPAEAASLRAREVKTATSEIHTQPAESEAALSPDTGKIQSPEQVSERGEFSLPEKHQVEPGEVKSEVKAPESAQADNSLNPAVAGVEAKAVASKVVPSREPAPEEFRIIEQIAQKATAALSGGRKEVQIQLDPPSLGKVAVKVTSEAGIITAHLQASAPAARDLLQQNLETLKAALEKADLGIGQCTVSLTSEQHTGGKAWDEQRGDLVSERLFASQSQSAPGTMVTRAAGWQRGTLDYFA